MHGKAHLLLGSMMYAALAFGCANGEEESAGSFSATNPSGATVPTMPGVTMTSMTTPPATEPGTGEEVTSNDPSGEDTTAPVTSTDPQTTAVDPDTTNPDPSTTAPDPSTTAPDPSTTAPDPSTTEPDPSTTNMTMTTMPMTTDNTTDDPPPPMKDNQPTTGLYEHCTAPRMCDAPSNVCLQLNDDNMQIVDGFCTVICTNVAQCGVAPNAPAVQECFNIDPTNKICGLKCVSVADCPTGMQCINLALPPPQNSGFYCI
jgi:hypothetical protein